MKISGALRAIRIGTADGSGILPHWHSQDEHIFPNELCQPRERSRQSGEELGQAIVHIAETAAAFSLRLGMLDCGV